MKKHLNSIVNIFKIWICSHKKILKRVGMCVLNIIIVTVISMAGLYFYIQNKYPKEIVFDGAYHDITLFDMDFSDRDISGNYESGEAVYINASNGIIEADNSDKYTVENKTIKIYSAGTYILTGELDEGMIIISAADEDKVQLVFAGFTISNSSNPVVYIKSADKVFLTTAKGTVNTFSDGKGYTYMDGDSNIDAAIFSKADLTLNGMGEMVVKGNSAHGVVSKDDLIIGSGKYKIDSVKKALNGKDCVKIYNCEMALIAGTDGICSDNNESTERGYIYIKNGEIDINCGNDGIQAENVIVMDAPTIDIVSGGGSINAPAKKSNKAKGRHENEIIEEQEITESMKGLKSAKDILISAGKYTIDSYDDSIHADHSVKICDGEFCIKSGDDGIHAEHTLQITNGKIKIEKSFEGLEAYQIAINGGDISVIASDDGINAASESSVKSEIEGFFAMQILGKLEITGGALMVDSEGDSIDSNGILTISGGTILVAGPRGGGGGDGIVDCDGSRTVNGGTVLCIGKDSNGFSGSEDYFETEDQLQIVKLVEEHPVGTIIEMKNSEGMILATFIAPKDFDLIVATFEGISSESDCVLFLNGEKQ